MISVSRISVLKFLYQFQIQFVVALFFIAGWAEGYIRMTICGSVFRTGFIQTFSRPPFFLFQTQGNSEILRGPRRINCANYENKAIFFLLLQTRGSVFALHPISTSEVFLCKYDFVNYSWTSSAVDVTSVKASSFKNRSNGLKMS